MTSMEALNLMIDIQHIQEDISKAVGIPSSYLWSDLLVPEESEEQFEEKRIEYYGA